MRILVYHAGALGDFITVLPALLLLREKLRSCTITLFGLDSRRELGQMAGCIDSTIDCNSAFFASLFAGEPGKQQLAQLGQFDKAILFTDSDNSLVAALQRCCTEGCLVFSPFPQSGSVHAVEFHCSRLLDDPLVRWDNRVLFGGGSSRLENSTVVIHPGSGSRAKNWPLERFCQVAQSLSKVGHTVVWVRGEAEQELCIPGDWAQLIEPPLNELTHLLHSSQLYIGNDSGVSHLAAACGTRTIALFGPTNPQLWAPRGPAVKVVCSPNATMDGIEVNQVLEACGSLGCIL